MTKIIIGLIGTNGSGKSTICEYLESRGFMRYSLSDKLRTYVEEKGGEATRDSLMRLGSELKERRGQDVLARDVFEDVLTDDAERVVLDSIRNPAEVAYLKSNGVMFIGVDAALETRYERITQRKRATDHIDFETFKRQDQQENTGESTGQNIYEAIKACESIVINDASQQELLAQVDQLLTICNVLD